MIATLFLFLLGLPLALHAERRHIATVIGEAYLLGAGAASLLLLALSMAGIPWSRTALLIGAAAIALVSLRGARAKVEIPALSWWNVGDVFTAALVAGYARLALAATPIEVDFIFMWGVKAKEFFFERAIDWSYLENPLNIGSHPDYPQLVPLVFDVHGLLGGAWDDRWLGIVNVAFGIATLLIVRGLLDELMPPWRVLTSVVLMPLVFSPYMGMAEGPIIAYSIAGLLHLRRGNTLRGAVFLGFGAFTKNEGISLAVAAAVALVTVRRWRELPKLGPAIAIPLPWLILRGLHQMPTDLMETGMLQRLLMRIADPSPIVEAMKRHPAGSLLFWMGIVAAVLVSFRNVIGKERFLTVCVCLQMFFFIAAFFVTPKDMEWHVRWAWERIVHQLMPLIALIVILAFVPEPRVLASGDSNG